MNPPILIRARKYQDAGAAFDDAALSAERVDDRIDRQRGRVLRRDVRVKTRGGPPSARWPLMLEPTPKTSTSASSVTSPLPVMIWEVAVIVRAPIESKWPLRSSCPLLRMRTGPEICRSLASRTMSEFEPPMLSPMLQTPRHRGHAGGFVQHDQRLPAPAFHRCRCSPGVPPMFQVPSSTFWMGCAPEMTPVVTRNRPASDVDEQLGRAVAAGRDVALEQDNGASIAR